MNGIDGMKCIRVFLRSILYILLILSIRFSHDCFDRMNRIDRMKCEIKELLPVSFVYVFITSVLGFLPYCPSSPRISLFSDGTCA